MFEEFEAQVLLDDSDVPISEVSDEPTSKDKEDVPNAEESTENTKSSEDGGETKKSELTDESSPKKDD